MFNTDGKYEKMWGKAHNLLAAYDNLGQMRELFAEAKATEEFITSVKKEKQNIAEKIQALKDTERELHARCAEEAEKIRVQKEKHEMDMKAREQLYTTRYETEYGNKVRVAQGEIDNMVRNRNGLDELIRSKMEMVDKLTKDIKTLEGQMDALNDQFKKVREALA